MASAGLALGAAAGCTSGSGGSGGSGSHPSASATQPHSSPSAFPSPTPSPSPSAAALPATTAWTPGPSEIDPQVKLRATQLIEALGSWPAGRTGVAAARARVSALGVDPSLVAQAGTLLGTADEAALQVIDAQYGGILSDSASVLVVCRQWTRTGNGPVVPGGTTVDVRLSAASPRWTVTALHPAQPGPAINPPPALARQVLADSRITLPPAATADLRSGNIHDSVMDAMLTLTQSYDIEISVVRSGHPLDVFGTTRPSDHPKGRAFDVWRINGHPVVDPATSRSQSEGFMRAAAAAGSYNVGGPILLSGGATANQFFSDDTHHDHVHVGFSG
jgi:hypothetical protein